MATGTSPSAAEEELRPTTENANFQRLTRLLMRGGLALLTEVFDAIHPNLPAVLGNPTIKSKLQTLKRNRVLTKPEWNCLYNPLSGAYGESTDFDMSLLYKLFRSICNLTTPVTGWDELPNSTDHSLEADIVRIRCYRNTIYSHGRRMEVTDADFEKLWMEISDTLLRIAGGISSAKKDEWKEAIEKFFREPLTPDEKEYLDELQIWHLMDMETKDKLEKVDEDTKQVLIKQDQIQLKQAELQKEVKQMGIQVEQKLMDIFIAIQETSRNSAPEVEGVQSPSESVETRIPSEQPSAEGTAGQSTLTDLQASQQMNPEVLNFWDVVYSFKRPLNLLKKYLKMKLEAAVQVLRRGSLIITVSCSSLEVLEELWKEYRTGHLNKVIQATLVSAEVLEKLNLKAVKLRTIISEEDYLSYKEFLKKTSGNAVKLCLRDSKILGPGKKYVIKTGILENSQTNQS